MEGKYFTFELSFFDTEILEMSQNRWEAFSTTFEAVFKYFEVFCTQVSRS